MSMLRKAKEKGQRAVREGIRAVNAERQKHFGTSSASKPPQQMNFRQIQQTNDAFEAILDDDSDLFGEEMASSKAKACHTSGYHKSDEESGGTQALQDDLFSDDFDPVAMSGSPPNTNVEETEATGGRLAASKGHTTTPTDSLQQSQTLDTRSSQERHEKVAPQDPLDDSLDPVGSEAVSVGPSQGAVVEDLYESSGDGNVGEQDDIFSDKFPIEENHLASQDSNDQNQPHDTKDRLELTQDEELFPHNTSVEGVLTPPTDTILSSTPLSSSIEDDNHLSPGKAEPGCSSLDRSSDDELSNTAAILEELLSPKSNTERHHPLEVTSSTKESIGVSPSATEVPSSSSESTKHMDSGIFDSENHRRPVSEERFDIQEDYFIKDTGETSYSIPSHKSLHPKRNSAGNLPPQRPPISPNLRRIMSEKSTDAKKERLPADDLFGEDLVKVQHPSAAKRPSPPHRPPMSANARQKISERSNHTKKDRIVADDLFRDDFVEVVHPNQATPSSSQPIKAESLKDQALSKEQPPPSGTIQFKRQDSRMTEEPELTLSYHLALSTTLYIYYSFNPWSYLSGLLAGFLLVYLLVGTVFVWYVRTQEQEKMEKIRARRVLTPSKDFLRLMDTNFEQVRMYQSKKFMATIKYDYKTHHPRLTAKAHVKLEEDFFLQVEVFNLGMSNPPSKFRQDIRNCTVTNVPEEVATNRKRRWNKKFPICITKKSNKFTIYLFTPTSRDKEDWFRRLRHAADGQTSDSLIKHLEGFFGYMQEYFPTSQNLSNTLRPRQRQTAGTSRRNYTSISNRIQYSRDHEDGVLEEDDKESISITRESGPRAKRHSRLHTPTPSTNMGTSVDRQASTSSLDSDSVFVPRPSPSDTLWLNAVAARLCWDIWHDVRWKDWVTSRIQKKLARIRTPSFMEQLTLTDVELGNDMPVVNRLCGGPRLDLQGIWVYLDVTYEGCFVMTIKTKLKLGKKGQEEPQGQQMSVIKSKGAGLPAATPHARHSSPGPGLSHTSAARALGTSVDPYDNEIDSGSSDEESSVIGHSIEEELRRVEEPHDDPAALRKKDKIKSMVKKVGRKVANTSLVRRAIEKVSSYPLVLTVVVNRLDGVLAINIPPPTTDTIWFAFTESPRLELTAKPKLGQREVKLSAVTQWIEKKLCEVVNKKLVLPEMEDICVKILNSGLPEDVQKVLVNENEKP